MRASGDWASPKLIPWMVALTCAGLAVVGAKPFAGGWNDGSRLAAVESLVDRHTLRIDDSTFCGASDADRPSDHPPYPPDQAGLLAHGTLDKLWIGGHFYSDKPEAISLLMAAPYQAARWMGLPPAAQRPDLFCLLMTLATSGAAYVVAVLAMDRLGGLVGLDGWTRLAWTASFGLATCALPYTRHVNNHILLLAVVAMLCLQFVHLGRAATAGRPAWGRLAAVGALGGLGYVLDLGAGPPLLAGVALLALWRRPRLSTAAVVLTAALPWLAVHHALNYAIGGVWKPMNMVPEYSVWPGGPFDASNLTGFARKGPADLALYAAAMLFGKHGFIVHNLPLLLAAPACVVTLRRPSPHRPELIFGIGWCASVWAAYSLLSNNYGGACCSIRWFVPLLAPLYFLLAVHLARRPESRPAFLVLSAWGALLGAAMWVQGPWTVHLIPLLWPVVAGALASWLALGLWERMRRKRVETSMLRRAA